MFRADGDVAGRDVVESSKIVALPAVIGAKSVNIGAIGDARPFGVTTYKVWPWTLCLECRNRA